MARGNQLAADLFKLEYIQLDQFTPLLVEDDLNQAMLVQRCARKIGLPFALPVIRDGQEAIDYLTGIGEFEDRAKYPLPTLVILDLNLPKKSGFEVLEWIRSQPRLRDLIVFILSTSSLQNDLERAMQVGANSYFVKPLALEGLVEVLQVMAVRWNRIHKLRPGC